MQDIKVFVIIVTYNAEKWLEYCLGSLKNSEVPVTVIVIDNNSQDKTVYNIKKYFPDIVPFESPINLGFGKANNIGMRYAIENDCDYVFLLNQDACINSETIKNIIHSHKQAPQFGIVSPIHLDGTGKRFDNKFFSYFSKSGGMDLICDKIINDYHTAIPYEVHFVNAAAWLISNECLVKTGGFDPVFPHYGEDNDFVRRVRKKGFKIGVCSIAFIKHDREQGKVVEQVSVYRTFVSILVKLKSSEGELFENYKIFLMSFIKLSIKNSIKLNFIKSYNNIKIIVLFKYYNRIKKSIIIENEPKMAFLIDKK